MKDFLNFKKMVTPVVIQFLFWIGVIACVIAGLIGLRQSALQGILTLLVGPLIVRIYCELLIVIFSINDTLTEMKNLLKRGSESQRAENRTSELECALHNAFFKRAIRVHSVLTFDKEEQWIESKEESSRGIGLCWSFYV